MVIEPPNKNAEAPVTMAIGGEKSVDWNDHRAVEDFYKSKSPNTHMALARQIEAVKNFVATVESGMAAATAHS
jgi:hypothetical protein